MINTESTKMSTYAALSFIDILEPRELDAWLAENVSGAPRRWGTKIPAYSVSVDAAMEIAHAIHEAINEADRKHRDRRDLNYLSLFCTGDHTGWAATFACVAYDEGSLEWHEPSKINAFPTSSLSISPAEAIARAAAKAWLILGGRR